MTTPSFARIERVLAERNGSVPRAAKDLRIPTADLRRLTRTEPRLLEAALERAEQNLDEAEHQIFLALRSDDPRRRLEAAKFLLAHQERARARGWGPKA